MAYLTLSDIEIPVLGVDQPDDSTGTLQRTAGGELFKDQIYARRAFSFETPIITLRRADAIANLIQGRGHHWSFDTDFYSGKGLQLTGTGISITSGGIGAKYGANYLDVGTSASVAFGASSPYATRWTVSYWLQYTTGSTVWVHVLKTDAGDVYVNGTLNGTLVFDRISGSAGTFSIDAGEYDDLVILPYRVPDEEWAGYISSATQAFGDLPTLRLAGDVVEGVSTNVLGVNDVSVEHINLGRTGTRYAVVQGRVRERGTRLGV